MKIKTLAIVISMSLSMSFSEKTMAQDAAWVRENTWYFDNFVQAILGWDIFRETYIGVAPEPSADTDYIFYEAVFKTEIASKGHCHGMCTMALIMLKNGGHLGFCHPPNIYSGVIFSGSNDTVGPTSITLKRAIQIMHGSQLTHGYLSFLLDVIATGKNRDGRFAFQQANYYAAQGDPCLISLTKSLLPTDGAHTLIAIRTQDLGSTKRIYVYDPNWSYYGPEKAKYDTGNNYIEINSSTGAWNASKTSVSTYSGSPSSGGSCVIMPISIAGRKDRLPQSLLAEGAYALNTIFIHGANAHLEQISDPFSNRQWLKDDGTDIETDPNRRLTNVLPFIPSNGGQPISPSVKVYFVRGTQSFNIHVRAQGKYRVGMLFDGKYREEIKNGNGEVETFSTSEIKN